MVDDDRWLEPWLNTVRERAGPAPVLELGCGNGRDTATLAAAGVRVVAVDLSARRDRNGASGRWQTRSSTSPTSEIRFRWRTRASSSRVCLFTTSRGPRRCTSSNAWATYCAIEVC
jgi:hypothetical protein